VDDPPKGIITLHCVTSQKSADSEFMGFKLINHVKVTTFSDDYSNVHKSNNLTTSSLESSM